MQARTEEIATKNLNLRPTEIWKMISDEMDKKSKTWKGMTDCQVKNLVKNTRARLSDYDIFRELKNYHYQWCKILRISFCNSIFPFLISRRRKYIELWVIVTLHYSAPCQEMCKYT